MTRLHNAELVNYECGRMNPLLCPRHHRQIILAVKTILNVWWHYATLFEIYYFFNIHSYNTITLRASFTIR